MVEDRARAGADGSAPTRGPIITAEELPTFLGPPRYLPEERHRAAEVGTVNGLAWTPYGGEVLLIEAQTMAGKGSLTLTGQLGDVMKESAQAALSFARAHALALGLSSEFYAGREIHIHVPAGGVPKDGPSAGVTMACALVSLISGIPVRHEVAMTGELTLRGKVLPDRWAQREAAGGRAGRDDHRDHSVCQRARAVGDSGIHHQQAGGAAGADDGRGSWRSRSRVRWAVPRKSPARPPNPNGRATDAKSPPDPAWPERSVGGETPPTGPPPEVCGPGSVNWAASPAGEAGLRSIGGIR